MSDRIREVLSFYRSENPDMLANRFELLKHERPGGQEN
jgi:hypothetical protein